MGSNWIKVTTDEVHLWKRITRLWSTSGRGFLVAFVAGCHSQEQDFIRADVPGAVECRITDTISSVGTRATHGWGTEH